MLFVMTFVGDSSTPFPFTADINKMAGWRGREGDDDDKHDVRNSRDSPHANQIGDLGKPSE